MIDAGFALAAAYYSLLSALTYNSKPVAVYSLMAPDDAVAPYVILGPWTGPSDNTKYTFGQSGEINLSVVTRMAGNQISKKAASDIANDVTSTLKPTPTSEVLQVEGFHIYNTRIVTTQDLISPTGTDRIVQKIITVSHSLQQV